MTKFSKVKTILTAAILFFGLFGLAKVSLAATNHFVRAGATGSANGNDWTNAYTALPSSLVRGDIYYIAGGSYGGHTFSDSGTAVTTIKGATASDHGTDTGWSGSYGVDITQAVFSGQLYFGSSDWLIDGAVGGGAGHWNSGFGFKIIVTDDGTALIKSGNTSGGNYSNITVQHVEMQGKGSVANTGGSASNDGIGVYGLSSITLSHAWMHGIGRCPVFGYANGTLIIEHTYFQSYFGSSGVHSELISTGQNGPVGDLTFRYNLVTDIESTGGLMWDNHTNTSAHMYVYGNIFYKPSGVTWQQANGVIGGWTGGNGEAFYNAIVYNNTFINVDQESLSSFPNTYGGNIASNNIFYNCTAPGFSKFATHDYNYLINSGSTSETNGTTGTSNPFVDYANLNFALTSATAAGSTLSSPTGIALDPLGKTRGADGVWDRGAFEYSAGDGGGDTTPPAAPSGLTVN